MAMSIKFPFPAASSLLDPESQPRVSAEGSSDDLDGDDAPLLQRLRKRTSLHERNKPRKSRCLLALGLGLGLVSLILLVSASFGYRASDDRIEADQEALDDCTTCVPAYDGLPNGLVGFASHEPFTTAALDRWVASGTLPSMGQLDFSNHTRLDGITFWVNGSDPRHMAARAHFATNTSRIDLPARLTKRFNPFRWLASLQNDDKRFRENNELLYNLRSAVDSLGGHLGTLHLVSTDYWNTGSNAVDGIQDRLFDGRRGQLPQWLNVSSESVAFGAQRPHDTPALRVHHDWETFTPLTKTRESLAQWKMRRLPTFDSLAAEAVLGVSMPGLGENAFLASDDMLLGRQLSTADFYTPLYGSVLHVDLANMIQPSADPKSIGEMVGLRWSTFLLQKRFGTRQFPYPVHVHKAINKPLLLESRMIWSREFEQATLHRFRADGRLANSHTLLYGMIVERHREALLWSFLVSKIDEDGNGTLDDVEVGRAHALMGTNGTSDIRGRMRERTTLVPATVDACLTTTSFLRPAASEYIFSSMDGFPLTVPLPSFTRATGLQLDSGPFRSQPGPFQSDSGSMRFSHDLCRMSMNVCWPDDSRNTSEIFTRFAFEEPSCGDCLIAHLVRSSGPTGLDAFLPAQHLAFPATPSSAPAHIPAHLPLGTDWKLLDFSLASVAASNWAGLDRRRFSAQLLQRYNYVIAKAPATFAQLKTPSNAQRTFAKLQQGQTAFICLNDDIMWSLSRVRALMQAFFESMWPASRTRLPFEVQP